MCEFMYRTIEICCHVIKRRIVLIVGHIVILLIESALNKMPKKNKLLYCSVLRTVYRKGYQFV